MVRWPRKRFWLAVPGSEPRTSEPEDPVWERPQARTGLRQGGLDLVDVELEELPPAIDGHAAAERVEGVREHVAALLAELDRLVGRDDAVDALGAELLGRRRVAVHRGLD